METWQERDEETDGKEEVEEEEGVLDTLDAGLHGSAGQLAGDGL